MNEQIIHESNKPAVLHAEAHLTETGSCEERRECLRCAEPIQRVAAFSVKFSHQCDKWLNVVGRCFSQHVRSLRHHISSFAPGAVQACTIIASVSCKSGRPSKPPRSASAQSPRRAGETSSRPCKSTMLRARIKPRLQSNALAGRAPVNAMLRG